MDKERYPVVRFGWAVSKVDKNFASIARWAGCSGEIFSPFVASIVQSNMSNYLLSCMKRVDCLPRKSIEYFR